MSISVSFCTHSNKQNHIEQKMHQKLNSYKWYIIHSVIIAIIHSVIVYFGSKVILLNNVTINGNVIDQGYFGIYILINILFVGYFKVI